MLYWQYMESEKPAVETETKTPVKIWYSKLNRVTWYSKALALVLFITLPIGAYLLGREQGALNAKADYFTNQLSPGTSAAMIHTETDSLDLSIFADEKPLSQQIKDDDWRTYYNPELNFAFKYPQEWFLTRNFKQDDFWDITIGLYDNKLDLTLGELDMQIRPIVGHGGVPGPFSKSYGTVMGVDAFTNGNAVYFEKDGYSFIFSTRSAPQTIQDILKTFTFVPPPDQLNEVQKHNLGIGRWRSYVDSKNNFAFMYPPDMWFIENYNNTAHFRNSMIHAGERRSPTENSLYVYTVDLNEKGSENSYSELLPELTPIDDGEPYETILGTTAYLSHTEDQLIGGLVISFTINNHLFLFVSHDLSVLDSILSTFIVGPEAASPAQ